MSHRKKLNCPEELLRPKKEVLSSEQSVRPPSRITAIEDRNNFSRPHQCFSISKIEPSKTVSKMPERAGIVTCRGHICMLCGYLPTTKNKYRELQVSEIYVFGTNSFCTKVAR